MINLYENIFKLSELEIQNVKKALFDYTYLKNEKNRDMPFSEDLEKSMIPGTKIRVETLRGKFKQFFVSDEEERKRMLELTKDQRLQGAALYQVMGGGGAAGTDIWWNVWSPENKRPLMSYKLTRDELIKIIGDL